MDPTTHAPVTAPVPTPADLQHAPPQPTGLRQRASKLDAAAAHPALQNARRTAFSYTQSIRDRLARSPTVLRLEKRTGVDRVALLGGGALLYFLLIPLNIFRLGLPTTQLLTFLPASYVAAQILDARDSQANNEKVKDLLSFFVVLGFIQTAESLMIGVLEKRIPQYYTVKLLFLAYLLHPKTLGARKIHESVFRPVISNRDSPLAPANVDPSIAAKYSVVPVSDSTTSSSGSIAPTAGQDNVSGLGASTGRDTTLPDLSAASTSVGAHSNNPFAPSHSTAGNGTADSFGTSSSPATTGLATSSQTSAVPTASGLNFSSPESAFSNPSRTNAAAEGEDLHDSISSQIKAAAEGRTSFPPPSSFSQDSASFPPPQVQAQQALAQAVQQTGVDEVGVPGGVIRQ
ncbi:hypothetical protein L198_04139 [Cryptococcus wingfieldii CBS 7118]|uniref:Protein YOP1 n=1 Tax=Cryptococcus wingfieldii CBS 7118 TaxID=1295528 RepID=A0A1E3J6W6_9TREE|nr:hypothetical protein L198_04139 [Cryptococcus wingfieldii CBS 7118]ODN96425.1 hypothetical protein L198_04139 [Cryptococcus wingfieldii CBS 7118]